MNSRALKTIAVGKMLPLLVLLDLPAVAQAQFTYTTNDDQITITGDTNIPVNGVVDIPDTINGYPGSSIGIAAFEDSRLTSVTIPDSVTNIGDWTFVSCTNLTSITIGSSVTSIGEDGIGGDVFDGCIALTNITVAASNPNYSSLGGVLFNKGASALLQYPGGLGGGYTIPDSVTSIGFDAFYFCTSLAKVTIGAGVTSIGGSAFEECLPLTGVYFQGDAPSIDSNAFIFDDNVIFYYLPGTTGWSSTYDTPWFLPNPLILNGEPNFGVGANGFGFTISWATNISVMVEAATNLANPVWIPLSTNLLTGGTSYFSDPQWKKYPVRFYRIVP